MTANPAIKYIYIFEEKFALQNWFTVQLSLRLWTDVGNTDKHTAYQQLTQTWPKVAVICCVTNDMYKNKSVCGVKSRVCVRAYSICLPSSFNTLTFDTPLCMHVHTNRHTHTDTHTHTHTHTHVSSFWAVASHAPMRRVYWSVRNLPN